jgi:hypothetical protein
VPRAKKGYWIVNECCDNAIAFKQRQAKTLPTTSINVFGALFMTSYAQETFAPVNSVTQARIPPRTGDAGSAHPSRPSDTDLDHAADAKTIAVAIQQQSLAAAKPAAPSGA